MDWLYFYLQDNGYSYTNNLFLFIVAVTGMEPGII
jgi:hypothetical protein